MDGEHTLTIKGLEANNHYIMIVRGKDKFGNEAFTDPPVGFSTSTDTRPPKIMNIDVEGSFNLTNNSQLVVSWDTDELATSQVEYGEGSSSDYSQKTPEDSNLTLNHLVVISNMDPGKVYHLRAISKDEAKNPQTSSDMISITPKLVESATNLVIGSLRQIFGF
jgi:hypothetical protein